MRTKTENILATMQVLAWVAFFALLIKAGAIIISFCVSLVNPAGAQNLYMGLDLSNVHNYSMVHYSSMVSLTVAVLLIEAYIAFLVIKLLQKVKMSNPFTQEVSELLEKISYYILGAWVVAMIYNAHTAWVMKKIESTEPNWISGEFIFLAGIVFVFAQIFKKGVEIQSENELTV